MLGVSTFGDLLKTRREKLGLRERVTFAKRANVGVSTIQQIELGVGEPFHKRSDRIRHAIADVLNMPVDQLDAISREESGESDGGANEAGLAPTAMQPAPTIPEWTISTSASAWASVPICAMECDDPAQAAIVKGNYIPDSPL
jgi:transcriptional regulator with XRE-family HTH domain